MWFCAINTYVCRSGWKCHLEPSHSSSTHSSPSFFEMGWMTYSLAVTSVGRTLKKKMRDTTQRKTQQRGQHRIETISRRSSLVSERSFASTMWTSSMSLTRSSSWRTICRVFLSGYATTARENTEHHEYRTTRRLPTRILLDVDTDRYVVVTKCSYSIALALSPPREDRRQSRIFELREKNVYFAHGPLLSPNPFLPLPFHSLPPPPAASQKSLWKMAMRSRCKKRVHGKYQQRRRKWKQSRASSSVNNFFSGRMATSVGIRSEHGSCQRAIGWNLFSVCVCFSPNKFFPC